jgi:hypothetical protein
MTNEQKKFNREERKQIEKILHPCPKINGIDILHEHQRNRKISFSAWLGENPFTKKKFLSDNDAVFFAGKNFYDCISESIAWLMEE